MSQPEFERYFKADVLDTDKLAKDSGIENISAATERAARVMHGSRGDKER